VLAVKVLLASNNAHKLTEVRAILAATGIGAVSPDELGIELDVEEDGDTFEANAEKKAQAFLAVSGLITLADDSGLEVDALGGRPGVLSARYAGPGARDADRIALLLRELAGTPAASRAARFVCVVAIASPGRPVVAIRGECIGSIANEPRGDFGFGYDPIFLVEGRDHTMAELTPDRKSRISHRGRAFRAASVLLSQTWSR
jgi:XTP/dITP diphosphohydrolase